MGVHYQQLPFHFSFQKGKGVLMDKDRLVSELTRSDS